MTRTSGALGFSARAADAWAQERALAGGTPVFVFFGDSNMRGASTDEAALTYDDMGGVHALNAAGAFQPMVPRTFTGLDNDANSGRVGPEYGFMRRWRSDHPGRQAYVVKYGSSGSSAAPKSIAGSVTGSISGNVLTVTSGSVAVGDGLAGAGLGAGVYVNSPQSASAWFLSQAPQQVLPWLGDPEAVPALALAEASYTKHNPYLTWQPNAGVNFRKMWVRIVQGFVALQRQDRQPYLAGVIVNLGVNDAADATAAANFRAAMQMIYRAFKSSGYWDARTLFLLNRPRTAGSGASIAAVRSGAASFKSYYRDVLLLDSDPFGVIADNVHYNAQGQVDLGSADYDLWKGVSAGL